jgi:glycosyltransferase involved in cell wall biosynthesis
MNLFSEAEGEGRYRPLLLMNNWEDDHLREVSTDGRCYAYLRLRGPWFVDIPLSSTMKFAATLPLVLVTLARFLWKHRVRVVNIHYPTLSMLPFSILKRIGVYKGSLIISLHGSDLRQVSAAAGLDKRYWRLFFRSSDAIVACSESLARKAREVILGCAERIKPVHNGVDIKRMLEQQDRDFSLDARLQSGAFVLNIGRFDRIKGQDILLKAFREICRRYPNLSLVMIGASGPAMETLSGLIRELGLGSRVIMYENLSHQRICAFMQRALLFILPSRDESFGIALLEAGAMSVPVIASRIGGIPEIIIDGESGLLVQPEDPLQLSDKIVELIENAERRKSLAMGLNKRVIERFTWKRAYHEYLRIIG